MEIGELPIVGRPAERVVRLTEQGLRLGRWALGETASAIEQRLEERAIYNLDDSVQADFDAMIKAEKALAGVEARESILTEEVHKKAEATIQVYVEHFARFWERGNTQKASDYARKIYALLPYAHEPSFVGQLPIDPICSELLQAELRTINQLHDRQGV